MKRFFSILVSVIVVLAIVFAVFFFLGWSRIPDMVASHLSKKMKVSVEINDINISRNQIDIDKLEIGNPRGYILEKAFSADTINIHAPIGTYLDSQVIIDQIDINDIYLGLEFDSPGSKRGNWSTIMDNLKSSSTQGKKGKSVLIKRLVLTGINVDLAYKQSGGPVKHLPSISRLEFTNVTSEEGIPSEQLTNVIFDQMLRSVFQRENLQNMIEGFMQSPEQGIQNALKPFKGFLNP